MSIPPIPDPSRPEIDRCSQTELPPLLPRSRKQFLQDSTEYQRKKFLTSYLRKCDDRTLIIGHRINPLVPFAWPETQIPKLFNTEFNDWPICLTDEEWLEGTDWYNRLTGADRIDWLIHRMTEVDRPTYRLTYRLDDVGKNRSTATYVPFVRIRTLVA